jgi:butyryl-CoA dehydrogenase
MHPVRPLSQVSDRIPIEKKNSSITSGIGASEALAWLCLFLCIHRNVDLQLMVAPWVLAWSRSSHSSLEKSEGFIMRTIVSDAALHWGQVAKDIADQTVRPLSRKYDELQEYPWEIQKALADAGLFGVWIPKEYGGHGAGIVALCKVVEELSRACGGVGVLFAVNALGSFPVIIGGTEEQKNDILPQIATGKKLIAFCLSEKFAGSDAGGMQTKAELVGNEYILRGEKKWTTNGGAADYYTVFAVTDPTSRSRRISAILCEKGTPGFSIGKVEDKMGIRCVPVVETHFDGVKVPANRLLGGRPGLGFKHAMNTLDWARPGVAAQAVGLAQGALDYATVYANRRKQFGAPISSFQMVQEMLADMSAKVDAARWLVYAAASAVDEGDTNVTRLAAECKYFATEVAMEVTTKAVQIFGGYGYMRDYPIEKFMRDAKITQIYEGANQIQKMVIARNLIKEANALSALEEYIPTEVQTTYQAEPEEEAVANQE